MSDPYAPGPNQQGEGQQGQWQQQNQWQQRPPQAADAWSDVPPPGTPGVSTAPMTGEPVTDSDARTWAMLAQLTSIVTGFLGPLIIYLMYKDRNRFVRFHAAEALNMAILNIIVATVLGGGLTIVTIVTFGIGGLLTPLLFVFPIYALVVAIIGAVRANSGIWWPYPLTLRMIS